MNPKAQEYLRSLGLAPDASDEEALTFLAGLKGDERAQAEVLMKDTPALAPAKPVPAAAPPDPATVEAIAKKAAAEAITGERTRRAQVVTIAKAHGRDADWVERMVQTGQTSAQAEVLAKEVKLYAETHKTVSIQVGDDLGRESLTQAIGDAILIRAGKKVEKPHERVLEFRVRSVIEMGRRFLGAWGIPGVDIMSRDQLASLLLGRNRFRQTYGHVALAMGMADFPFILEDSMRKSLRQAYQEQEKTWPLWCRRVVAADYKDIKRLALSDAPDLTEIPAGKGVDYVTLSETKETYALAEYVGGLRFTRRAIINDDLDAFGRAPELQAAAAARKEDDVVYAVLTDNEGLSDGHDLFDATYHGNYVGTGTVPWFLAAGSDQMDTVEIAFLQEEPEPQLSQETDFDTEDLKLKVRHSLAAAAIDYRGLVMDKGSSITVATLAVARQAMRAQTGPKGGRLNLKPKFLIVGGTNETVAEQFLGSVVDPAKSNATPNPFAGKLTLVVDNRVEE